jgi:hypothetical protein
MDKDVHIRDKRVTRPPGLPRMLRNARLCIGPRSHGRNPRGRKNHLQNVHGWPIAPIKARSFWRDDSSSTSNDLDACGVGQEATDLNHNVDFARTAQRKRQRDVDLVETVVIRLRPGIQDRNGSAVDEDCNGPRLAAANPRAIERHVLGVSTPSWIGTLAQLPGVSPQRNTGRGICNVEPAMTRIAEAATTPRPSPFAVNSPGAMSATFATQFSVLPSPVCTLNGTSPALVPAGISKLI